MNIQSFIAAGLIAIASVTAMAPAAQARDRTVVVIEDGGAQLVRDHRRDRDDRRYHRADRRDDRGDRRYDRRADRRDRYDRRNDRRPPWHNRDRRDERGNWKFEYR